MNEARARLNFCVNRPNNPGPAGIIGAVELFLRFKKSNIGMYYIENCLSNRTTWILSPAGMTSWGFYRMENIEL